MRKLYFSRTIKLKWIYIWIFIFGAFSVFSYNLYFFHSLSGGYSNYIKELDVRSIMINLAGLFVSPSRGVIFYTPFYFLSLGSLFYWSKILKGKLNPIFLLNLAYFVSGIALYSLWDIWWGGNSWGNRFFTDIAVPAVILSYFSYKYFKSRILQAFFTIFLAYGVLIQLIGVFGYPNSYWNSYPQHVDIKKGRLWDFKDNPIVRSTVIGSDWSSGPRLFYWLTNKSPYRIYSAGERRCSLQKLEEHKFLGYRSITVSFKNASIGNWATTGEILPFNSLTLRQIFFKKGTDPILSPIIPNNFPILVKSGQEIIVRIVVIPPQPDYDQLIIAPTQENQFWIGSCQLELGNS